MKRVYLIAAIIGTIIPYSVFIPWLQSNGLNMELFINEWFANRIAGFFAADFLISWLVFTVFMFIDSNRKHVKYWWISLIGNCCIGLSFALPFYLYLREDGRSE